MIKNEIKILSDIEHVLLRKSMYIGATSSESREQFLFGKYQKIQYVPGLVKIIEEILNNSVDEAVRTNFEHANKISVSIVGNEVVVEDNGRGIPQYLINTPDGQEIPAAVAAWTKVKAGSNFDDSAGLTVSGQNGVGSSLTNIFSKEFIGSTCDGEQTLIVHCKDNMSEIDWKQKKYAKQTQGTSVTFTPDFNHFECEMIEEIVLDIIKDQMNTLAVTFPLIAFKFNGERIQGNFKKYAKQFDESAIISESETTQFAIGRSDDGFRHLSYVNAIHTKSGGVHVDYINDELSNELIPMIKRKYKIDVTKSRIKECITMLLFLKGFPNARFDSQTKEKLSVPLSQIKTHVDIDVKKIAKSFMANEELLMPIIESVLARKLAAEKAAETKAAKKATKAKVAKHIKANKYGDDSVETTLFLAEGDSAIGFLLETRDRDLHGGFPLRGKVLNSWGLKPSEILANKELFEICAITGLTIGEPAKNINYKNIAIMVDSDVDGTGSIYPSLLSFFSNWPELFENGQIRFVKTPIIIATKNNDVRWYYTLSDYDQAKPELTGFTIRYIKGLGSLNRDEYAKVINEPKFDIVKLDENWKENFNMLFGDDPELRKKWMSA